MINPLDGKRRTSQKLAPLRPEPTPTGAYDVYPVFSLQDGSVQSGFDSLALALSGHKNVVLDGFGGVFWMEFVTHLTTRLARITDAPWEAVAVSNALRPPSQIDELVRPFLGGDDPLFGTRFTGELIDFYDKEKLDHLAISSDSARKVLYGPGAALAGWDAPVFYLDLPKNEYQFRSRAGAFLNLGAIHPETPKSMYKRAYFVDWPVLNAHKATLLNDLEGIVDTQRPGHPVWMTGNAFRDGLAEMSRNYFRVRPWFEPGAWGGQWIREHIRQLETDVPNYAWSFELIVPENGLMFGSDQLACEVSFDWLMTGHHRNVLGEASEVFGSEFPIRFDFLDTMEGGNLSLQCHPKIEFIREHFGESFTQDETYYILENAPDAEVYLGFQDDIDPDTFKQVLEDSATTGNTIDVSRFVQHFPARKHDLFLIPSGTIHCSGKNNMVLEISATPYIFTFKMYDWQRLDLDGKPRPLNIERAFKNLDFSRKGSVVEETLLSRPSTLEHGKDFEVLHLPTHPEHFYDVHRLDFSTSITVETEKQCHVLNLVEGSAVTLETAFGRKQTFNYAETFVVPAAATSYRLTNKGEGVARVVKAFVKPGARL